MREDHSFFLKNTYFVFFFELWIICRFILNSKLIKSKHFKNSFGYEVYFLVDQGTSFEKKDEKDKHKIYNTQHNLSPAQVNFHKIS